LCITRWLETDSSTDHIFTTIFTVKFEDGKTAYIRGAQLQRSDDAALGHLSRGRNEVAVMEYLYDESPKKLKARIAGTGSQKNGVRIGMTAAEVRASSWGKPFDVNRTTTASGVREQWVYPGGSYLYFTNGIVSAIQN
jgi:hypothetical protein